MKKRLFKPEVFDYIHLCALEFVGIGAGSLFWRSGDYDIPNCVYGMARILEMSESGEIMDDLFYNNLSSHSNDIAVRFINMKKKNYSQEARVSFEEYIKQLEIDVL